MCSVDELLEELAQLREERDSYKQKHRESIDESQALRKYKQAFEMLVAELAKK